MSSLVGSTVLKKWNIIDPLADPTSRIGLISPQGEENAEQNGGNIDRTNETSTSDITNSTTDVPQDRQTNQDDAADEEAGD